MNFNRPSTVKEKGDCLDNNHNFGPLLISCLWLLS